MKSWKTTLVGILGAAAAIITFIAVPLLDGDAETSAKWMEGVGAAAAALGLGWFARDNDKSSEDVGAKKDA